MSGSRNQPRGAPRPSLPDGMSPVARAAQWTSRIMTISMEMVLPGLAGYWLDQKLGTKALFMLVGFALGGTAAFGHLLHLANKANSSRSSSKTHFQENEREDEL